MSSVELTGVPWIAHGEPEERLNDAIRRGGGGALLAGGLVGSDVAKASRRGRTAAFMLS